MELNEMRRMSSRHFLFFPASPLSTALYYENIVIELEIVGKAKATAMEYLVRRMDGSYLGWSLLEVALLTCGLFLGKCMK